MKITRYADVELKLVDEDDNHYTYITVVNNELSASAVITKL